MPGQIVIPRHAIHTDNNVYLVDKHSKLKKSVVQVAFFQGENAVISHGLLPGDQLITSDVVPAIEGMSLKMMLNPSSKTEKPIAIVKREKK